MIYVNQVGNEYQIKFQYDPMMIDHVKNIPGRKWNAEGKYWSIPANRLGWLVNEVRGTEYEGYLRISSTEELDVNQEVSRTTVIPNIDISKIPFYVEKDSRPYEHQLDFMKWAIDRQQRGNMKGFLLADEMGLAKTAESFNLALYNKKQYNFKHCLVICCINSSKFNWVDDITKHTNGDEVPYILGTRIKRDGLKKYEGGKEKLTDIVNETKYGGEDPLPYFIITNIESIRYKENRKYKIADAIIDKINNGYISTIIIDEIHKNASPSSLQGKQLLRIKKATGSKCQWIPMTGTPITKKPTDLFLPLRLIDAHDMNSYYNWCQQFCVYGGFGGYDIVGYKNMYQLKAMLDPNMLRRVKEDVLDLPPKIRYTEYVENTQYQERLYKKVQANMLAEREDIIRSLNPMVRFLKLRQVNGSPELVDDSLDIMADPDRYYKLNAKLQRLMELLKDAHDRGEKTLVFSNWVETLRTLYKFVSTRYKTCCFTGTMRPEDREHHKQVFMQNPEYTVMLGTIGAMGTTHTLTAARNVIFYDDPWNPSDKEQAEDRAHRIGTKDFVNIYTLVTKGTVDEKVESILYAKQGVSKYIVDNKLDIRNNPELFDLLLGYDRKRGK